MGKQGAVPHMVSVKRCYSFFLYHLCEFMQLGPRAVVGSVSEADGCTLTKLASLMNKLWRSWSIYTSRSACGGGDIIAFLLSLLPTSRSPDPTQRLLGGMGTLLHNYFFPRLLPLLDRQPLRGGTSLHRSIASHGCQINT